MHPILLHKKNQKGMVLLGVISVMIFAGLMTAVGTSLITTSTAGHNNLIEGAQALAITHAGVEWYLEQLENDTDWSDETTQTFSFAEGGFTITPSLATAARVTFTSTGTVTSPMTGVSSKREMTLTVRKLPRAFLFAVFQGTDPGVNFEITNQGPNATTISGDVWSQGSVEVDSGNTVQDGTIFVPDTETVTGAGTYTSQTVAAPYPAIPVIDSSYYTNLIAGFDATLDANNSNNNRTVSSGTFDINNDPDCSGGVCEFRTFTTTGTVTITGNGTISVNRDMDLHGGGGAVSLTITPSSGGSITFLADRDLEIGGNANPPINAAQGCTFYSRSATNRNQRVLVRGSNTVLDQPLLIARTRVTVEGGADIINEGTLFVDHANNNRNYIEVNGAAGVTSVDGSLISISQNDPAILITNGGSGKTDALVTGVVYAYGSAMTGYCEIEDAAVQGSVVCNRFSTDRLQNVAITYSLNDLPSNPLQGFDSALLKEPNSWDGL